MACFIATSRARGTLGRPAQVQGAKAFRAAPFTAINASVPRPTRCRADASSSAPNSTPDLARRDFLLRLGSAAGALLLLDGHVPAPALAAGAGPRQLAPDEQAAVTAAFKKLITKGIKAPLMLRLAFHDAGTFSATAGNGGSNASIQFELQRPENSGLKRGWGVVEQVAQALQGTPAAGLSNADIVALAGAWAVEVTGGPKIVVPVGRADATAADPEGRLPSLQSTPEQLKASFADKGLSVEEMVALSGAHTIGGKGFGDPVTFDNTYYKSLLERPWLKVSAEMAEHIGLPSDRSLPDDPQCGAIISRYAANQAAFFADFSSAYVKMTSQGARWA